MRPIPTGLREAILGWYDRRGRSLSFRGTTDPYEVLVSEVMAQQTQISRVAVAWSRFIAAFPTIASLAAATPADVLRAWQGMGYNRRALNLWRVARVVVDEYGGVLPSDVAALERLPGIGPYTARAVAAIAFGTRVGAVDTNVRRVLGRVVFGDAPALSAAQMQQLADSAVPIGRPADWTHALMDIGATLCRPRSPDCGACPAQSWCRFAAESSVVSGPVPARRPRPAEPRFQTTSRWLRGRILDRLREANGQAWVRLDEPIGDHPTAVVADALKALASEGLLELDAGDPGRARLPLA